MPANRRGGDGGASRPRCVTWAGGVTPAPDLPDGVLTANVPPLPPEHATASSNDAIAMTFANLTAATITRTLAHVAERFAPLVRDQRAALLGALAHVEGDAWDTPTVCAPWTVKDVAAHLVESELLLGRIYRGELEELGHDNGDDVGRWTKVDGSTVRYSLWHHGEATQRVIDSRSDESWRRQVTQDGATFELRHALRIHFFELAVHGHDITSAIGAPNTWDDRAWVVVEACIRPAPRVLAAEPARGSVVLRIPEIGSRTLVGSGDAWRLETDEIEQPTAVWDTDAETFVLATTGRLAAADALARSKVDGDAAFLASVVAAWRVVG